MQRVNPPRGKLIILVLAIIAAISVRVNIYLLSFALPQPEIFINDVSYQIQGCQSGNTYYQVRFGVDLVNKGNAAGIATIDFIIYTSTSPPIGYTLARVEPNGGYRFVDWTVTGQVAVVPGGQLNCNVDTPYAVISDIVKA